MRYKGYTGVVELDEEQGTLHGRVIGLRDLITFQGDTVPEVVRAFEDSVDDYLEFCAERGEDPEKPYSGNFVVRIEPQLHRTIANEAEARKVSLNALIAGALAKEFTREAKVPLQNGSRGRKTLRVVDKPADQAAASRPRKESRAVAAVRQPRKASQARPHPHRPPKPAARPANQNKPPKPRKS
jgi:predicted HicB family RNase H-like nuclease